MVNGLKELMQKFWISFIGKIGQSINWLKKNQSAKKNYVVIFQLTIFQMRLLGMGCFMLKICQIIGFVQLRVYIIAFTDKLFKTGDHKCPHGQKRGINVWVWD